MPKSIPEQTILTSRPCDAIQMPLPAGIHPQRRQTRPHRMPSREVHETQDMALNYVKHSSGAAEQDLRTSVEGVKNELES